MSADGEAAAPALRLWNWELSANCYKVRLMLALLGVPYEPVAVDFFPGRENLDDAFLAVNPLGELPVIEAEGMRLAGSNAILAYLVRRHDPGGAWLPVDDPVRLGATMHWLGIAEGLNGTAGAARLEASLGFDLDGEAAREGAHRLFRVMERHLWFAEARGEDWLVSGAAPTVADVACFPAVVLSEEGGVSREDYPAIRRWSDRVKRLPGFAVMPGVFAVA